MRINCMLDNNAIETSPLQLKQLLFGRINVEAEDSDLLPEDTWAPGYDMEGVLINSQIQVSSPKESKEPNPNAYKRYVVGVTLQILNSEEGTTPSPYTIDIEAQALFEMAPMDDESKRDSLVRVNGASVIIASIRELVTQLTARSIYGPLTLPTLRVVPDSAQNTPQRQKR